LPCVDGLARLPTKTIFLQPLTCALPWPVHLSPGASPMRNRPTKRPGLPAPPREERPPVPEFAPVPRKYRHDGWTPERQKAFIEALADCGSVTRAAAMVNMAQ